MGEKIWSRKSEEGVSDTRYAPKLTIEEYTSATRNKGCPLQGTDGEPRQSKDPQICKNGMESGSDSYAANIYCQLLPVLAANIGSLSSGLALGYSAVLLPQLRPDDAGLYRLYNGTLKLDPTYINYSTTRHRPFTVDLEEGSWIAGIFGIGAIFGALLSAYLGNQYGRKMSLILLAVPDLLGWILVASSQNLGMMLAGRFLAGFAAAGYSPNIQIYVGEITQPQHRGWLSALTVPITAIGVLTMYVVGSILPWHLAAASCTPVPLLMVVFLMFYWDSPYWYAHIGKEKSALQALEQFRGEDSNSDEEMFQIFEYIRADSESVLFLEGLTKLCTQKKYLKPFVILNCLFLLMLFSGKFAIDFYAVEIVKHFEGSMNEYLSAVIIAFISLIGSLSYIPLVKRFSRKILICFSALVMGVSLLLLGLCMYSHTYSSLEVLRDCSWLPMICIVSYMIAAPMGLCSIPFIYIAEFYPSEMRSLMGGLTIAISNLELFIVVKTFPNLEHLMGDHGVFWLYAFTCFCAIVFTLSYIPETKDKDLTKVEHKFAKLGKVVRASPWVTPVPSPSVNSVRKLHFKGHMFTQ
jgi:SP family facilitated glucose transporter-like MFS transporter 8